MGRSSLAPLLLVSGCALLNALSTGDADDGGVGPPGGDGPVVQPDAPCAGPCRQLAADFPAAQTNELDIVFVVNDSSTMEEEQAVLAASFVGIDAVVDALPGGRPDLRVGVTTTDVGISPFEIELCRGTGDHGRFLVPTPVGCGTILDSGYTFLIDRPGAGTGRDTNYTGTLAGALACLTGVGTNGCGFERPLDALHQALDNSNFDNQNFLRDGSILVAIVISDEDDCSAFQSDVYNPAPALDNIGSALGPFASYRCTEFGVTCDGNVLPRAAGAYSTCQSRAASPYLIQPGPTADFLRVIRDPAQTVVAVLAGPRAPFAVALNANNLPRLQPSCEVAGRSADPAVRLAELADVFPHALFDSLCASSYAPFMASVVAEIAKIFGNACLAGNVGAPPDCKVYDVLDGIRAEIPACGATSDKPCYRIVADSVFCPATPTHLRVRVDRTSAPLEGAHVLAECVPR